MDSTSNPLTDRHLDDDRVAITGMALRVPGADNADELWRLLDSGSSTVTTIPPDRFDAQAYRNATIRGVALKASTGNFVDGLDKFDNEFFNVSPREAKSMDPQQRLLLHVAHEALEDAGFVPRSSHSTDPDQFGVFIGAATNDHVHNVRDDIDIHYVSGTLPAFLSGRLSHALSLGGPSTVYDTVCSSSGVALHAAVRSLCNGDCRMALVGGVNAMTSPDLFIGLDSGGFLSRTGQSRPFDAEADGYSRGEGCVVFILKRLPDALLDNDRIIGIIRSIEMNQSYLNSSITRTHSPTQAALLRRLLQNSHLEPTDIDVVEAHAAGTRQGDTSELLALRDVFIDQEVSKSRQLPLYLSSIKASIGHLEAASGAASLAKVLLMMRHQTLPPQIGIRTLNSALNTVSCSQIRIPFEPTSWPKKRDGEPRRAIVNNYGAAGSNVSILVEEYVELSKATVDSKLATMLVLGLSAKSERALLKMKERHLAWLDDPSTEVSPLDYCYSSTARRQLHDHRLSLSIPNDKRELIQQLKTSPIVHVRPGTMKVVFIFPGHGSQYPGMGRVLYESLPAFRQCIDECGATTVGHGFPTFLPYLVGGDVASTEGKSVIEQTALLSFEVALSKVWVGWGVSPSAVVGHSLGEYAALVTSGILSIKDALLLVGTRAQLVENHCAHNHSGMMSVALPLDNLEATLRTDSRFANLVIACRNAEHQQTVAGPLPQLEALREKLHVDHGVRPKPLPARFAYHSPAMLPIVEGFAEAVRGIIFMKPTTIFVSTVTGRLLSSTDENMDTAHLLRHCLDPVQFCDAVESLSNAFGNTVCWIEVSPRRAMLPLVRNIVPSSDTTSVFIDPPTRAADPWTALADGLARLYTTNVPVEWKRVFTCFGRPRCISLPAYSFQSKSFYIPYQDPSVQLQLGRPSNPLSSLSHSSHLAFLNRPTAHNGHQTIFKLSADHVSNYSVAHRVVSMPVCPASIYLEAILSALSMMHGSSKDSTSEWLSVRHLEFVKPFSPGFHPSTDMTMTIRPNGCDEHDFTFSQSIADCPARVLHARGQCQFQQNTKSSEHLDVDPSSLLERVQGLDPTIRQDIEVFSSKSVYDIVFPRVVEYALSFRSLGRVVVAEDRSAGQALMALVPAAVDSNTSFVVHPAYLDPMVHLPGFIVNLHAGLDDLFVCAGIGSVDVVPSAFSGTSGGQAYQLYTTTSSLTKDAWLADTFVLTLDPPNVVAVLRNIQFRRIGRHAFTSQGRASRASTSVGAGSCESEPLSPISLPSRFIDHRPSHPPHTPLSFRAILSSSLHIPEGRITDASVLEAMGLDSLTSIEVLHTLRTHYDPALPSEFFQGYTTVGEVEAALQGKRSPPLARSSTPATYCCLEQIQEGDSTEVPLCLIHDGSGLVSSYRKLACLGRPVWAIRAPDIEDAGWETVEEMAAYYASAISSILSDGVILAGWSFGGVVAFELAKQLLVAGMPVQGLVLLDAPPPSGQVTLSQGLITTVLARVKNGYAAVLQQQLQRHVQMISLYRGTKPGSPIPLPCIYVRCAEGYQVPAEVIVHEWYTAREDIDLTVTEWESLLGEDLVMLDVPGHHFEMFHPSRIETTSQAISKACGLLEQASMKSVEQKCS